MVIPPLLEKWAAATPANIVVYVAQSSAGTAEDDAVLRFVVLFIGVQARVMTYQVAHLKIVVARGVILGGEPVYFSAIVPYKHSVLGVIVDVIIVVVAAGALAAVFLLDGFIDHHTVPGFASFSGNDGIERNNKKHAADAKADEKCLRVLHFAACFTIDVKTDDGGNGEYHREQSRPAVGAFEIPGKRRVMNPLGVADVFNPRRGAAVRRSIRLDPAAVTEAGVVRQSCPAMLAVHGHSSLQSEILVSTRVASKVLWDMNLVSKSLNLRQYKLTTFIVLKVELPIK